MRVTLLIAVTFLFSCTSNHTESISELEQLILQRPLVGAIDFYSKTDSNIKGFNYNESSYNYFFRDEFNDSIPNGFYGPVTENIDFKQFISFDIEGEDKWEVLNQTAFHGRLVQNSKKGPFSISQSLFFADSLISISVYTIQNNDQNTQDFKPIWNYYLKEELKLENRKGFVGLRFITSKGEYWPHCSGRDDFSFNSDSTIVTKKSKVFKLFPKEKIDLYSVIYIRENLDTILPSNRPKPWIYFPEEQLDKNILEWSKKLD